MNAYACHYCCKVLRVDGLGYDCDETGNLLDGLRPPADELTVRRGGWWCSVECEKKGQLPKSIERDVRSLKPLLERIAVALEKLAAPPEDDLHSAFLSTCSFCGATPFRNNTGHGPKCTNPDRR